jgi:transcriptional regulator with XRE-family HTH domain
MTENKDLSNPADVLKTIKAKIKKHREQIGYSQEDVSQLLEMSASGFSKIESGTNDITLTRLVQIANILKMNLSELFEQAKQVHNYHNQAQIISTAINGTNYGSIQQENDSTKNIFRNIEQRMAELEAQMKALHKE